MAMRWWGSFAGLAHQDKSRRQGGKATAVPKINPRLSRADHQVDVFPPVGIASQLNRQRKRAADRTQGRDVAKENAGLGKSGISRMSRLSPVCIAREYSSPRRKSRGVIACGFFSFSRRACSPSSRQIRRASSRLTKKSILRRVVSAEQGIQKFFHGRGLIGRMVSPGGFPIVESWERPSP